MKFSLEHVHFYHEYLHELILNPAGENFLTSLTCTEIFSDYLALNFFRNHCYILNLHEIQTIQRFPVFNIKVRVFCFLLVLHTSYYCKDPIEYQDILM